MLLDRRLSRRRLGTLLAGTVMAAAGSSSLAPLPTWAAEGVRILEADWVDETRGRRVPVRLYWPATSPRPSSVPLIVFSHGLGNTRQSYRYLGKFWSAAGFASLHVQHVGSDSAVWQGNPLGLIDRLDEATDERKALARAIDLTFALDRFLDPGANALQRYVDRRRVIAAGHSFGANTTLIVLGASVMRGGLALAHRDPRFGAGIVISAPPFYGEKDLRTVLRGIDRPTLHVTATDDVIEIPGRYSAAQDRLDIYNALSSGEKAIAVFQGGSHSIFTDRTWTGGVSLNPKVKAATAEVSLAFLQLVFQRDPAPILAWNTRWQDILAVAPVPFPTTLASRRAVVDRPVQDRRRSGSRLPANARPGSPIERPSPR
jgi:predicted dienelactone hydrolase